MSSRGVAAPCASWVWSRTARGWEGGLELDTTVDSEHVGLRIGRVYNQAPILSMLDGPQAGAVVYLDEDVDEPQVLGADLSTFFERLTATGLSIEALIA